MQRTGLPCGNGYLLGDSGFDDQELYRLCQQLGSLLVTPIQIGESSALERHQKPGLPDLQFVWAERGQY